MRALTFALLSTALGATTACDRNKSAGIAAAGDAGEVIAPAVSVTGLDGSGSAHEAGGDTSIAEDGAACAVTGRLACSGDGATELICQNGHFKASRHCKKEGCSVSPNSGAVLCR